MVNAAAKGLVLGVGGAAGLYVASVAVDVYRRQREEHDIGDRVIAELTAARAAREAERREEAVIAQRQQEVAQHQQKVQEVEAEIGGLQSRLSELEGERAQRAKAAADAAAALEESHGRLSKFVQEARRRREAAAAAEAALAAAHAETAAAKALYNPLHHPMVRSFRAGH
ncbi:hypothetical protein ABPG75_006564 [Micractinium tetrahymenae]